MAIPSRFHVAAFGLLGYELDLCSLPEKERTRVAGQIVFYKKYRETLQFGRFYRMRGGEKGLWQLMAVSVVRLPGEKENLTASGDVLMKTGAWLKQSFSGTGYGGQTRVMGDSGSRMYVLTAESEGTL